jgi:hypothetical protein
MGFIMKISISLMYYVLIRKTIGALVYFDKYLYFVYILLFQHGKTIKNESLRWVWGIFERKTNSASSYFSVYHT